MNLPSSSLARVDFGGTSRRKTLIPPLGIPLVDLTNCNFTFDFEKRVVLAGLTSVDVMGRPGGKVLKKIFAGKVIPEKLETV